MYDEETKIIGKQYAHYETENIIIMHNIHTFHIEIDIYVTTSAQHLPVIIQFSCRANMKN